MDHIFHIYGTGVDILHSILNHPINKILCFLGLHDARYVLEPETYEKSEARSCKYCVCIRCNKKFRFYLGRNLNRFEKIEEFPWKKDIPYYFDYRVFGGLE